MSNKRNRKPNRVRKETILDVVVTTAGRFDMLEKCLSVLYSEAQKTPINVYVVDNASNAEERINNMHLFEYHPENDPASGIVDFKSKRLTQNVGFPGAANEGARMGRSPLIMFLSDDVELQEGVLEKVIRDFDEPTIGIVGIKLLFPPTSTSPQRPAGMVQHVGLALNIRAEPYHPLLGWKPTNPRTISRRESPDVMGWDAWAVTGACFTIRRNLFQKAGGFDSLFGKGTYEDVNLCLQVRQMGSRIYMDTSAVGYHYVGATVEKRQEGFPLAYNQMLFHSRWSQTNLFAWDEFLYY